MISPSLIIRHILSFPQIFSGKSTGHRLIKTVFAIQADDVRPWRESLPSRLLFAVRHAYELFVWSNNRGYITYAIFAAIAVMTITYLIAFFAAFSAGFEMENRFQELSRIKNAVNEVSFTLREQKTRVTEIHKPIFTSMEKISSIQYIQPSNVALSSLSSSNE